MIESEGVIERRGDVKCREKRGPRRERRREQEEDDIPPPPNALAEEGDSRGNKSDGVTPKKV